jgi:multidrug efflux system outer membrane protein
VADFFPRIGLTSLYGGASNEIDQVVSGTDTIWALAGQLTGPLLQGGRNYD